MKILHLEDISEVTFILENELTDLGFEYERATSIFEINEYLNKFVFDCIILDLNLPADGLNENLEKQTKDGKITGWIWLKHVGLPKFKLKTESIIIYSDYTYELDDINDDVLYQLKKIKKRKGGNRNSSIKELHKSINKIKNSLL